MITTEQIERFSALFDGYEQAHGRYDLRNPVTDRGKVRGKASTVTQPAQEEDWRGHLDGTGVGIGAIPLRSDNCLRFAALDIDRYPIDHMAIVKKVAPLGLVVCRTKSGGAHVYWFTAQDAPAEDVMEKMAGIATALGFGGCEVFPKQSTRSSERDIGNWINLPYFDAEQSLRYAFDPETGEALDLDGFLSLAESYKARASLDMLGGLEPAEVQNSEWFQDGPPCLQRIAAMGGFIEGTRNEGLFNVAVYLRKKYGAEDWADYMKEYADGLCSPPPDAPGLRKVINSTSKKEYQYRCRQEPLKSNCNKRACLKRTYGVGGVPGEGGLEITSITKYLSDPVLWCVEVSGKRIELNTTELLNHNSFAMRVAEELSRVPAPLPPVKWRQYLDEKMQDCDEVPAPEDASERAQFKLYVLRWLTGRTQAKRREEMLLDKPWRDNGRIYFMSNSLKSRMDQDRYKYDAWHEVWQWLKAMGAEEERSDWMIDGQPRRPWSVPDPRAQHIPAPLEPAEQEEF